MASIYFALVIAAASFVAALIGMALHVRLPDRHLDADSKDVVKLVLGLIATMAALVLGLLIAQASSSYNAQSAELESVAADVVLLDRMLAGSGPDAQDIREKLRAAVVSVHDRIWPPDGRHPDLGTATMRRTANSLVGELQSLVPRDSKEAALQNRILILGESIAKTRLLMSEQVNSTLAWPFLAILVFWIVTLFLGFGMFARFNPTVTAALFVGAISVGGAIFLILELNRPYEGILRLSDEPFVSALAEMRSG